MPSTSVTTLSFVHSYLLTLLATTTDFASLETVWKSRRIMGDNITLEEIIPKILLIVQVFDPRPENLACETNFLAAYYITSHW